MIEVRPATPSDAGAIAGVTSRAFADAHVADLVGALAAGPARVSLVAVDASAVVGHVMLSRGWLDAERELVEVLVLSPLSVDPPRQRTGIGASLVRAALAAAKDLDTPAVFLEGAWGYYARFGFEAGASRGFVRPSSRIPGPAFQVVVLPAWRQWMTGVLVYPDAFWASDSVGLRGDTLRAVRTAAGEVGD
ncbi:MAG: GNAT family N-acetyltransferase [Jatrophihabitantaceae bacterium]